MVARHEPLVTPEPARTTPWKARRNGRIGKTLVQRPGGRTARQAHRKGAVARQRETAQPFGNIVGEHFGARESLVPGDDVIHEALGRTEPVRGRMKRSMALAKPSS